MDIFFLISKLSDNYNGWSKKQALSYFIISRPFKNILPRFFWDMFTGRFLLNVLSYNVIHTELITEIDFKVMEVRNRHDKNIINTDNDFTRCKHKLYAI